MYGLEAITRGSRSLIERSAGAASIYFSDAYNRDDDERNWSFSYLREQLILKNSQELFRRYQVRVQHALFVELLAFNVVYNALSFIAYIFLPYKNDTVSEVDYGAVLTGRWCRSISFVVQFCIFIASFKESLFRHNSVKIGAAGLVFFCMTLGEMATSIYRLIARDPQSIMRPTYYLVLTTTVLLPFPRKLYSGISAAAVIMLDIMLSNLSDLQEKTVIVTLVDATFHTTTLVVGLTMRYLIEIMSRRAFLDRRECIASRIKVETEKHQEDKFLQTILPNHIAREVREDIRNLVKNMDKIPITHKPFNKLYIEKHKGVSILYADIVNSMLLAASLKVSDLVETLNDLFGSFDDSAEKNGCMRIKLLGDCYYCVSGIPKKNPRHADNCVLTGFDMINIIRSVREERSVNVDMRIGIHSGNILGGLLGLRKWQFDIWSRDVTIASHMEQGGVPGQIHITKATKDNLQDIYDIYPGNGHQRDAYIQREEIETFLIKPRQKLSNICENPLDSPDSARNCEGAHFQRQISSVSNTPGIMRQSKRQSSSDSFLPMGRRGALGYSLHEYRKMVNKVNQIMEISIDKMALSKKDQWFSKVGIHPLLLTFREPGYEKSFLEQPDPLFKYYLLCMVVLFVGITIIHLLIMSRTVEFWISYGVLLLFILAACIPSWFGYIWLSFQKDDSDQLLDSTVLKISRTVWKTTVLRVVISLTISIMILCSSIAGLNECFEILKKKERMNSTVTVSFASNIKLEGPNLSCAYPWFYTLCAALAMTTTSVFLRMHFLIKLIVNGAALGTFWYIMDDKEEDIFLQQTAKLADWDEFGFPADQGHCYYLTFVVLILHVLDRQVEYICRLDFLNKVKLEAEQEEAHSIELVNRMLLFNILPPHVSKFYLNRQLEDNSQRIETSYHEERLAVAVLFASIPNYADFNYEDNKNDEDFHWIKLLNEIICEFDLLSFSVSFVHYSIYQYFSLFDPPGKIPSDAHGCKVNLLNETEFHSVEKIKTIGSTYMAACGLQSFDRGSFEEEENPSQNVGTLVKFGVAMMASLQQLNRDAMQDLQLRIGISVGHVMAGVVGTVKPQFDIWGDTVNVASRMDSTGIVGRIQVIKEVADLICARECPYEYECRGEIFVKGKGMLTTYLIKTPYDEPQIETTAF